MEEIYSQLKDAISERIPNAYHDPNGDHSHTFEWTMYCEWDVYRGPMAITLDKRPSDILITTKENHNLQPWEDGSQRIGTTIRSASIKTLDEALAVVNHFLNVLTDC